MNIHSINTTYKYYSRHTPINILCAVDTCWSHDLGIYDTSLSSHVTSSTGIVTGAEGANNMNIYNYHDLVFSFDI